MPIDPQLLDLAQHVFVWQRKTGQDAWQKPTYAADVEILGYHTDEQKRYQDDSGAWVPAAGTVYLADVYGVKIGDVLLWDGVPLGEIVKVTDYYDADQPYGSVVLHG